MYPTAGRVELLGRPAGDIGARQRIGYLPENPSFYDYLTAEELLGYFARLFGYRGREVRERVGRLLDDVGIGAERRMALRKFSKGMLQRVGIAQALVNDPELVVLDEPMSGLDPLGRRDVRQLVLRLRERGVTVFFSSHVLSDAEALCNRVAILARGRLVATGRLDDLAAFEVRGWELVMSDLTEALIDRCRHRVVRATCISEGRYALELALESDPERLLADLAACGARLVSLNPIRDTLEDFFVQQVTAAAPGPQGEQERDEPRAESA
jgi:ABC-2 type transport system ATP-binding protein